MARIVGAIATSHTPTIGFAFDGKKGEDPVWKPIFEAYAPIRAWLDEKKPDALFVIYNDHITSFFFDHYSAFCLGIGEEYSVADEGGGPRNLPPIKGHGALARHIGNALMADEFDMSFFQDKPLDHGCFSPLSILLPHEGGWPMPIVPLQMGVLQFPVPSAKRCYALGQSLRTAIESYPEDLNVAIVATGGLSHQVQGERCGFNNPAWDEKFLDLLEKDPVALTRMTHADHARLGGMESSEIIMWLVMRGALSASVKCLHRSYYLPSMTAIATAIYENQAEPMSAEDAAAARARAGAQTAGVETLEGTYLFDLDRSVAHYRLNRFLHDLVIPDHRAAFMADEESAFAKAGLPEQERDMIRRRDWQALIRHGAIFFVLEKLAAVVGVSNPAVYAAFQGKSLDDFLKTRNTQVVYSVGGNEAHDKIEAGAAAPAAA
ncbi:MAG: protocatechuate 3,4-dioxygenase [Sphingomonas bacterium]|nr:protocatechuate 3,4-dioxygenase [Sphingomonas bacterium]